MLYEESRRASIEAKSSQGGGAYGSMHFNSVVGEKTELGPPDDPNMFQDLTELSYAQEIRERKQMKLV